jgi:hypothetical protein
MMHATARLETYGGANDPVEHWHSCFNPAEEAIEISAILAFESTNLEAHIGTICLS